MFLKRPDNKVTLTFAGFSLGRCRFMGCFSFTPSFTFLKGCTFVGLWYGSKETREESDFDICKSQSVQIVGQWDALVLKLHLFF
jgi:hypothetical protein